MSVRFCHQCNNMLYPKDNRREMQLYYRCRRCNKAESVDEPERHCVYKNMIKREINMKILESVLNLKAYTQDPSLPKTRQRTCQKCNTQDAVFFMNPIQMKDDDIQLYFTCINCKESWVDDVRDRKESGDAGAQ
eukprot:TRINITY_DN31587_c0_g2_i1.p3 TRINITY_DN31587_c0_g2~~TRINITY_DN31587_c0_g2_i1.p3  ORF type:complete len:134 (+),score=47.05 TRINITY_DN31587_c0_g2_i1:83-484(+)